MYERTQQEVKIDRARGVKEYLRCIYGRADEITDILDACFKQLEDDDSNIVAVKLLSHETQFVLDNANTTPTYEPAVAVVLAITEKL